MVCIRIRFNFTYVNKQKYYQQHWKLRLSIRQDFLFSIYCVLKYVPHILGKYLF